MDNSQLKLLSISAALMALLTQGYTAKTQQSAAVSGNAQATGQAATGSVSTAQQTAVNAELKESLDSRHARVGQQVTAVTRQKAMVGNTTLPKGTTLLGHVTEVSEHSKDTANGSISMLFDQARLKDGTAVPIHATIRSLAPYSSAVAAQSDNDVSTPMGGGSMDAGGGVSGGRSGGGRGLVGGTVSGATSAVGSTTNTAVGAVDSTTHVATQSAASTGNGLAGGISNVPGVNLTASDSASTSGTVSAPGKNVHLYSGTQMTLGVSAQ